MKKGNKKILILGILIVALIVSVNAIIKSSNAPGDLDEFALCLTEKGVKMYGTDTCHFCQEQKNRFEKSFKKVDYINCNFKSQECYAAGIKAYPTWEVNGELYTGLQPLQRLSSLGGCAL